MYILKTTSMSLFFNYVIRVGTWTRIIIWKNPSAVAEIIRKNTAAVYMIPTGFDNRHSMTFPWPFLDFEMSLCSEFIFVAICRKNINQRFITFCQFFNVHDRQCISSQNFTNELINTYDRYSIFDVTAWYWVLNFYQLGDWQPFQPIKWRYI